MKMELFGVTLVGVNQGTGHKLLLSVAFLAIVLAFSWTLRALLRRIAANRQQMRTAFWTRQGVSIFTAVLVGLGLASIWFSDPEQLTAAAGLAAGGLAFALQKVVTSLAGYLAILRGRIFTVGDRINMGGVRGDVIAVGFMHTRIMEMGMPPESQPGGQIWVKSRQFTGRSVTVSNSQIFEEPVFNYTRDFPFIWEEITLRAALADRRRVEAILLDTVRKHTKDYIEMTADAAKHVREHYMLDRVDLEPRVYFRLVDSVIEITVRFVIGGHHDERGVKDEISRDIADAIEGEQITLVK
jgi:small-conductance mechanosensitive channel